jgi:NADH dehydrogenase
MILLAGGTGTLGTRLVPLLTARGLHVRILTRDPKRAAHLRGELVEVVEGDVLDAASLERAAEGAHTVISAMHGFDGSGGYNPQTVDRSGNRNLIEAARKAKVKHFILLSINGAAADHPIELFRMKYAAEQELRSSGLSWTIIRPAAYMETWARVLGELLLKTGKTMVFGPGTRPINFVSATDVARFVELAVVDPSLQGEVVKVGGPENLSFNRFVEIFEAVTGKSGPKKHLPLPVMRAVSVLMRPINPILARQAHAGVIMNTRDMSIDTSETVRRYPSITPTRFEDVVRREYGSGVRSVAGSPSVA